MTSKTTEHLENSSFITIAFIVIASSMILGIIGFATENKVLVTLWFWGLNVGGGIFVGDYLAFMLFKAGK